MISCIFAVQHLGRMGGGSQPRLLKASDGESYVTQFQNNPRHVRVLANEMLATRLGLAVGFPMPSVRVIEVSDGLITHTPDLRIQWAGQGLCCQSGRQLGLLYGGGDGSELIADYLPNGLLASVRKRSGTKATGMAWSSLSRSSRSAAESFGI